MTRKNSVWATFWKPTIIAGLGNVANDQRCIQCFEVHTTKIDSRKQNSWFVFLLVLHCCSLWLDGKTRARTFPTNENQLTQIQSLLAETHFFCAWRWLQAIASNPDWFNAMFASVVIGHSKSNCFGFGFTKWIVNRIWATGDCVWWTDVQLHRGTCTFN